MACFSRNEAEEFIANRSSSRLKHGLIALSFGSKYVQYSISYRGAVLWNAIGRSNGSQYTKVHRREILFEECC